MVPITKPEIFRNSVSDIYEDTKTLNDIRYIVQNELPPDSSNLDSLVSMKVCRICLAMDVKMYDMSDHQLNIMFERVTGIDINTDNKLPQKLCWECVARLESANNLVEKVLKTQWILFNIINSRKFTMISGIESIKEAKNQLKPTLSKVSKVNDYYLDIIEKSAEIINEYKIHKFCVNDKEEMTNSGFEKIQIKNEHIDIDFEVAVTENEVVDNNGIYEVKLENNIEEFDIKVDQSEMHCEKMEVILPDVRVDDYKQNNQIANISILMKQAEDDHRIITESRNEGPIQMEVVADVYLHQQEAQQPSRRNIQSTQTRPSKAERQRRYREKRKANKMNACTFSQSSDVQPQQEQPPHDVQINKRQPQSNAERQRKYRKLLREQQQQQQQQIEDINAITVSSNTPRTSSIHQLQNVDHAERARKRHLNKQRQRRFRERRRLESPSTSSHQLLQAERSEMHCEKMEAILPDVRVDDYKQHNQIVNTIQTQTIANHLPTKAFSNTDKTTINNDPEKFICDLCGKIFKRKSIFINHIFKHPKSYTCTYCSYKAPNKTRYNEHINARHTKTISFKCSLCNYTTSLKQSLSRHVNTKHSDKDTYKF